MFDRIAKGLYWDRLWRLVDGCTMCSPGCEHCWSAKESWRMAFNPNPKIHLPVAQLTTLSRYGWTGQIRLRETNLDLPLRTKKPQSWLVLNDLFHEQVSDFFIAAAYGVASVCPEHTFFFLTKRADRMLRWYQKDTTHTNWIINEACVALPDIRTFGIRLKQKRIWPLPNVWIGVTVCNQQEADEKIPLLLQIPAAGRWLSIEPMIEAVDPNVECGQGVGELALESRKIHWIILGGESGSGARPMYPDWVRSVRDQCQSAGVPFFFKQMAKRETIPEDLKIRELPNVQ